LVLKRKIVVIPTYNEKENIGNLLSTILRMEEDIHILVVDDNSPDGTADIVKKFIQENPETVHILSREKKEGLGKAYVAGFKWCLEKGYNLIAEMDADFSHNPYDLPRLFKAVSEEADVAIGSRYVTGVNVVNWSMSRVLMSYLASKYVRFITGLDICDATAGFVCYRKEVLEKVNLDKIKFKGYAFQIEMKFKAFKKGFYIVEVPIIFTDRSQGVSKMSLGIFKEAFWGVIELKLRGMFGKL
jgi:dolichol-phosphate mannosyltransferase